MSELEPTITELEPTATERLRALLDERGVEWRERVWGCEHSVTTFWHARGVRWHYRENRFGELRLHADGLAPEQAIAATLGKELDDASMLKLHDRMNAALLEYERALGSEKADGAITVPFVAEMHHLLEEAATLGISDTEDASTDTDGHDLGHVRNVSATLGSCNCSNSERTGTCHLVRERVGRSGKAYRMVCSECHHVIYDGWQEKPRYCAFCGARVENDG